MVDCWWAKSERLNERTDWESERERKCEKSWLCDLKKKKARWLQDVRRTCVSECEQQQHVFCHIIRWTFIIPIPLLIYLLSFLFSYNQAYIITGNIYVCIGMSSYIRICILSVVNACMVCVCVFYLLPVTDLQVWKCEVVMFVRKHWCVGCVPVSMSSECLEGWCGGESWRIPKKKKKFAFVEVIWMPSLCFVNQRELSNKTNLTRYLTVAYFWLLQKLIELQKLI